MSDSTARGAARAVYTIHWSPGSDRLHGVCHCGAEQESEDPILMWRWLLAHPDHQGDDQGAAPW